MDVMKSANKLCYATVCADVNASIDEAIRAAEAEIQEALDLFNMAN